jgi:MFS family permease
MAATQNSPGRLDPVWVAIVALGFTQIIAWGTTLYCLGVLLKPVARDTGWSLALVSSGLTVGLLASGLVSAEVGRRVDRHGGRLIMSLGSLACAMGLAALSMVGELWQWLAVWAWLGVAMRLTLYDAAFAAIVQVTPSRGRWAISILTLFGGLASTIFWPIGFWLEQAYGWRATLLVFSALNLFVCLPLHWFGLAHREAAAVVDTQPSAPAANTSAPILQGAERRRAFLLFGAIMAASAYTFGAMAMHLVTVLIAAGLSAGTAVGLAAAKGVAQTLSRLGDLVFGRNLHALTLGRITLAFLPLSFLVLLIGDANPTTAAVFIVLFGIANGLTTIVRGAVPLALFGTAGYGEILGRLAAPYLVINAVAPTIFALVSDRFGGEAATWTLLAAGLLAWGGIELMAWWYRRLPR